MNDISSTVEIQHGDRFSSVILKNMEADIWCELCRFKGANREERAEQIFTSVRNALHFERHKALKEGASDIIRHMESKMG